MSRVQAPPQAESELPRNKEREIAFLDDVSLPLSVELGRASLTVRALLSLQPGSIIQLGGESDQPLELRLNGKLTARGEVVCVNDHFGVRITEIVTEDLS